MQNQPIFKSAEGKNAILAVYDSILDRWPVPYETLNIPTHYGNTFIIACGEPTAPPMLLLHGSGSNSAMWIGDVAEYCRRYRVYAVDMPGEPGRSEAVRHELNSPAYGEWLKDIFTALNLEKATLTGISLGGWVSLKFSTTYPERVEKLVLLCPSGAAPQKMSFMFRAIACSFFGQKGVDRLIRIINGDQAMQEEAIQYSRLIANNFSPRMEVVPIFPDEELERLTMPVLLIAGARDVLLPSKKTAARLQRLLPRLTTVLLPEAGHVLIGHKDRIMSFLSAGDPV